MIFKCLFGISKNLQIINSHCIFFLMAVLSEIRVKEYLLANPHVLENFIMADTSQEQLERWLIRKTQSIEHITGNVGNGTYVLLMKIYNSLDPNQS